MTEIKSCGCAHAYQDERYGRGMRVFNLMGKVTGKGGKTASSVKYWRCTVCKGERL